MTQRISKQYQEAEIIIRCFVKMGGLFGIPKTAACCIAIDEARRVTGIDFAPLLINRETGELNRLKWDAE